MVRLSPSALADRVFDLSPNGLLLLDVAGRVLRANARAEVLLGYEAGALDGQPIERLFPGGLAPDPDFLVALAQEPEHRRLGRPVRAQARRQDGSSFAAEVGLSAFEADGDHYVLATVRNPAEWPQEDDAGSEGERFRVALRRSPVVVGTVDRDLRYTWVYNPQPHFRLEDAIGKRDDEIASGEGVDRVVALKRRVLDSGVTEQETIEFALPEETRTYDIVATPLFDEAGGVSGVTSVAVDVSDLRRMMHFQRDFMAKIAHDLRGPITVMNVQAQTLLRRGAYEEQALADIVSQGRRLTHMVDDLLDTAAMESGRLTLRRDAVDLAEVAREAVRYAAVRSERHEITLVGDDRALEGQWDRARLEQVMDNLLTNAIKYSPGGGGIAVTLHHEDDTVRITVRDEGIGLAEDEVEGVFECFGRTDAARRSGVAGLGLGLCIAKGLVEAHGGTLTVTSEGRGRGCTFSATLPRGLLAVVGHDAAAG